MKLAFLLLGAACLPGCLFEQPLAPGRAEPPDGRLPGTWRCLAPDSDGPAILTVTHAADGRYRAEFVAQEESPSVFDVYPVRFEGKQLLNAQEVVEGRPGKWSLARYTLFRPTVLHIEFQRNEPLREAATQAARVEVVKRLLKQDQLFEGSCTCIRIARD